MVKALTPLAMSVSKQVHQAEYDQFLGQYIHSCDCCVICNFKLGLIYALTTFKESYFKSGTANNLIDLEFKMSSKQDVAVLQESKINLGSMRVACMLPHKSHFYLSSRFNNQIFQLKNL